jgi:hypothetical protein
MFNYIAIIRISNFIEDQDLWTWHVEKQVTWKCYFKLKASQRCYNFAWPNAKNKTNNGCK